MEKEKNGKKWLIIAAAAVAAGLLAAAALMIFTARRREQMEECLDLGGRYMNDLNYEDAIVAFQKAVDIDPRNKEAAIGLAGALEGDGQYEQAEAVYLTVPEKYPAEGEAYVALAELYIRLGRQDEARELLAQAVSRMEDEEVVRLYGKTTPKPPVFSVAPGTYDTWQMVEIRSENREEIIYVTMDGTEPDEESLIYEEPLILPPGASTLKAKVFNSRGYSSETATAEYQLDVPDREIRFEDPGVEILVRRKLGIYGTPVYERDAVMITSLTAVGRSYDRWGEETAGTVFTEQAYIIAQGEYEETGEIHTLTDLKYMPFLSERRIAYQDQLSLEGLESCTRLESLSLIRDNLTSAGRISGLVSLKKLSLARNRITDLTPLSGLTGLTSLSLWDNQITSLDGISGLTELRYLDISGNQVTDLTPVSGLVRLRSLWMYDNQVSDLTPLKPLEELSVLMFRDNPVTDLSVFKSVFPRLTRTDVSFRQREGEA